MSDLNPDSSEILYRELVENLKDVIYSVDSGGKITYLSPSMKFIGGFEPSELIGKGFVNLVHKDDQARLMKQFGKYISGYSEPTDILARLIVKSGQIVWVRISVQPIRDKNGFKGIRGVLSDITQIKLAEEALREIEERYRAVWENSPVGICLTDRDGIYQYVNPAYCEIYGYAQDELVGRPFYEAISNDNSGQLIRESHNIIFESGDPIPLRETEFIRHNGERVWIAYKADFVRKNGMPVYLVSMNVDISERKRAEIALKASEEKYRLLLDNAVELIISVEENGKIFLINMTAAKYLGGNPNDFKGRTIREIFPKEVADIRMKAVNQVMKQSSAIIREEAIEIKGEKCWFKTRIQPVFDYKSGIKTAQIISLDITEDKKKSQGTNSRVKLLENLRNSDDLKQCLQYACDTLHDSMFFRRSVLILRDDDGETIDHGQYDADIETVQKVESCIGFNENNYRFDEPIMKISRSFIVPPSDSRDHKVPEQEIDNPPTPNIDNLEWRRGYSFWTPMIGEGNKTIGWLWADSPCDGKIPSKETIIHIEEIANIVTQHIRELRGRIKLKDERRTLENTNVTLKEVMAAVEEEKWELRERVIKDVDTIIMPILEKLISEDGTLNLTYFDLLRKNLEALTGGSGGSGRNIAKLTSREFEICEFIKNGSTNKGIADILGISVGTVKKHREAIRKKLGLRYKSVNLTTYLQSA